MTIIAIGELTKIYILKKKKKKMIKKERGNKAMNEFLNKLITKNRRKILSIKL